MNLVRLASLLFCVFCLPETAFAAGYAVVIGGGPNVHDSQASIELNTRWVRGVLNHRLQKQNVVTIFTDGGAPGLDVRGWRPAEEGPGTLQPLARVFDWHRENGNFYYNSVQQSPTTPADADNVNNTIRQVLSELGDEDDLLIVYQGHGGYDESDTNRNSLRLWGNTEMTVSRLESILAQAKVTPRIRFIFPQCYSGAFTRLMYQGARPENGLAAGPRCGFVSQDEHLPAEGCTASIDTDDYRDYTSYFFSALTGKNRNGKALAQNPDRNHDGKVTLREAHLFTLAHASSIDFSRSTSEVFLENWQPWYFRWLPVRGDVTNEYHEIANNIATRLAIKAQGSDQPGEIKRRIHRLESEHKRFRSHRHTLWNDIEMIQEDIQSALSAKWPAIRNPYTKQHRDILLNELDTLQTFILRHKDYDKLRELQQQLVTLNEQLLENQREAVQLKKILRLQKLAQLQMQFNRFANKRARGDYAHLLACEESTL